MEDVLDLYAAEPDPVRPLVCLDEKPYQLLSHVREPLPAAPGVPRREDYEYKRESTCNLFLFFAPHDGWRHIDVTERRTAVDFAHELKWLVDVQYPEAEGIRLVVDNLNTHSPASLYKTFAPEEARRIARKLEWHYTPKHGSWLNMCELELSVLSRQCLKQRLPSRESVAEVTQAWQETRNAAGATVRWHFRIEHARIRLARLYPEIQA
jgi:hypothetical protein